MTSNTELDELEQRAHRLPPGYRCALVIGIAEQINATSNADDVEPALTNAWNGLLQPSSGSAAARAALIDLNVAVAQSRDVAMSPHRKLLRNALMVVTGERPLDEGVSDAFSSLRTDSALAAHAHAAAIVDELEALNEVRSDLDRHALMTKVRADSR
jgi:hypothetical protein